MAAKASMMAAWLKRIGGGLLLWGILVACQSVPVPATAENRVQMMPLAVPTTAVVASPLPEEDGGVSIHLPSDTVTDNVSASFIAAARALPFAGQVVATAAPTPVFANPAKRDLAKEASTAGARLMGCL